MITIKDVSKLNPAEIAMTASARHIQSVIEDLILCVQEADPLECRVGHRKGECTMTEAEKELIALRLWKDDALEALAEYRAGEERNLAMIKEMHEVIVQIADTAHQQQMSLSKYIEVKADYFSPKKKKPKVSNV